MHSALLRSTRTNAVWCDNRKWQLGRCYKAWQMHVAWHCNSQSCAAMTTRFKLLAAITLLQQIFKADFVCQLLCAVSLNTSQCQLVRALACAAYNHCLSRTQNEALIILSKAKHLAIDMMTCVPKRSLGITCTAPLTTIQCR